MSESPEFEYYEGFFIFHDSEVEVLIDEATFDEYMHAYLMQHEIDPRTEPELMAYATDVGRQHIEAEKVLHDPEYWLSLADPRIRILQRAKQARGREQSI